MSASLFASAQRTTSKSEKISYATHETNTAHSLKASYSHERSEKVQAAFVAALGKAKQTSTKESTWAGDNYTASLSANGFKANLDKEKASAKEIAMFKQLSSSLYKALDQPEPPQAPAH